MEQRKSVHDLILWTSCLMLWPCAQKVEGPTMGTNVRHGHFRNGCPAELSAMIWSRQLSRRRGRASHSAAL